MKRTAILIGISLSLAASASGCASGRGEYPSLAIRDGERMTGSGTAPASAAPTERLALSTDTAMLLVQLGELGRANHEKFTAIAARAGRLVAAARGTAITTKANASAQIALAELQSAHEATLSVLAELDVLLAEATLAGSQLSGIDSARSEIAALSQDEQARLAGLGAALANR